MKHPLYRCKDCVIIKNGFTYCSAEQIIIGAMIDNHYFCYTNLDADNKIYYYAGGKSFAIGPCNQAWHDAINIFLLKDIPFKELTLCLIIH